MELLSFFAVLTWLLQPSTLIEWRKQEPDIMIVPNLERLNNATATLGDAAAANNASEAAATASEIVKKAREFWKHAILAASTGIGRTVPAAKAVNKGLQDRGSCASGSQFYSCANGFTGCCSVDPCDPLSAGGCPDGKPTSSAAPSQTAASTGSATTEGANTTSDSNPKETANTASNSASATSKETAKASSTHSSSILSTSTTESGTSTAMAATTTSKTTTNAPPDCPGGNNTVYTDNSKIAYTIHCNADNSFPAMDPVNVSIGGYDQCFSACSKTSSCAGFTFVGVDGGDCYLKSKMPNNTYLQKAGSNYISCAKVDPTASSALPSSTPAPKKSSAGTVAGGVIGGVAVLALLLVLVAYLAKRRRKKIDERRATVTHIIHGPLESVDMTQASNPGPVVGGHHARTGSTAHDAFAPFGGFYRGFSSASADRRAAEDSVKAAEATRLTPDRPPPSLPPGARAEAGKGTLQPSVYQRPGNPSTDAVAMLDSTPIKRPGSQTSGSRSPRFREHIAEMEDTSYRPPQVASPGTPDTDSPTLGRPSTASSRGLVDEVKHRQHMMSWNTYDPRQVGRESNGDGEMSATMVPRTPPAARSPDSPQQVSPDLSNAPRDSKYVVSPFGSLDRGRPLG